MKKVDFTLRKNKQNDRNKQLYIINEKWIYFNFFRFAFKFL